MDFPAIDDEYKDAKQKAKLLYKSIGNVWCPALNDFVVFDDAGFLHLVKKGRLPRPKSEQKRRFFALRYVENILKTKQPFSTDELFVGGTPIRYWKFITPQDGNIVKIVIRQIDNRQKHFLSIYGTIKNPRPEA